MKDFAKVLSTSWLRPTIKGPDASTNNDSNTKELDAVKKDYREAFITYFAAFYDGKFVDRFGTKVAKPSLFHYTDLGTVTGPISLSISVSDADIAAALTVLIEFLADLLDPTPVLGTTKSPGDKDAVFYPGGNKNKPTVLEVKDLAHYRKIPDKCGVNEVNAKILLYVANAAGDEAQLVNSLVTQSFGGFGFSLIGFAKFSFGDNQTLGTIVKTVASRAAMRITLAVSFWAIECVGHKITYDTPQDKTGITAINAAKEYLSF